MNMCLPVGPISGTHRDMSPGQWLPPSAQTRALLAALKLPGVGPAAVRKLAAGVSPDFSVDADASIYEQHGIKRLPSAHQLSIENADSVIDRCCRKGIFLISTLDEFYPRWLKRISDAPPVLYVRGSVASMQGVGCAVVGTRNASDYGLTIAFRISAALADNHVSVVSGLALGIDTAAHKGALASGGITIAVMAHGLDTVAPSSNRKLAEQIVEEKGALVSEHEPGVPPRPAEFVRRNRIQSGMSLCSIIVESGEVGGSMHQARFTRGQGRPVLAILPENGNGALKGFNHDGGRLLVKGSGATAIRNTDELMMEVKKLISNLPKDDRSPQGAMAL